MAYKVYSKSVTTAGSAGSATGTATLTANLACRIDLVYIDWSASAPNTSDITIAYSATPPGGNILAISNSCTDALVFPRATCVNNANSAIANSHTMFPWTGDLTITVGDCDALTTAVTVYVGVWTA